MLTTLKLEQFKNFKKAALQLGPLTVLIGVNASGKSNIRDAFRFLHGIARGYNLAEIMGEKYLEGGVLQWRGIRGGRNEAAYRQSDTFSLEIDFEISNPRILSLSPDKATYSIVVAPGTELSSPRVVRESLYVIRESLGVMGNSSEMIFDSHPTHNPPDQKDTQHIIVKIPRGGKYRRGTEPGHIETFIAYQPVLTQISERVSGLRKDRVALEAIYYINETIRAFNSMQFLDLNPDAMRLPSLPGQIILGDRGENLSSVLQAICEDPQQKKALIEWVRELTPMDATDFRFIADQTGRILVNLVEESGQVTSAYSASDGTLRFLTMIAALLGPKPARFYFFEEFENGLHPARLHLLLQLVERRTSEGAIQMVATTHSPQLLRFLSLETVKHASLVYRQAESSDARIRRIMDIAPIQDIIKKQDLARLHESGWFEDAMTFLDGAETRD
jgi:predicted ATPase